MPTFGSLDVIQDQSGNALANVQVKLYASLADAKSQVNLLASATTNSKGQWPVTVNGYDMVWVRDPAGNIWTVPSDTVAGDHSARLATLESGPALTTSALDSANSSLVSTLGTSTRGALNGRYVAQGGLVISLKDTAYGAKGDNTTNDTAAIVAWINACQSAQAFARTVIGYAPHGSYLTDPFTVPGGVSLRGDGRDATRFVNRSTAGGVFVVFRGSHSHAHGIDFDGQHAAQLTVGLACVQFSRPNNPTAGALNISGGVVLTTGPASGATSLAVNTASPGGESIRAGEYVTLVEGANYELAQVSETYTSGLTLPLSAPLSQAFSVAAQVSIASTNVSITDCTVRGNGRDGIAFWHCVHGYADRNHVFDYEDTGIDFPDAGSRFCRARGNFIETKGRWGVFFDTAATAFGHTSDCTSESNTIRFLSGGSYTNGNTIDGIGFGVVDRCKSINDTVDITLAGISGARFSGGAGAFATDCVVSNLTVIGPKTPRASTSGVRNTAGTVDNRMKVLGGTFTGVDNGVDVGTAMSAHINGVTVSNYTSNGVTTTADSAAVQSIAVIGVTTQGGTNGVRFGGTPNASSKGTATGCVARGWSFAAVVADAGWTVTQTANIP